MMIYLDTLSAGNPLEFTYRLKAKYPLKAKSGVIRVYECYNPDHAAEAAPVRLVVR